MSTNNSIRTISKWLDPKSLLYQSRNFIFDHPEFLVLIGLMIILIVIQPNFFTLNNVVNIIRQASVIGIVTCAVTLIIISGTMDLSVGSIVTLTAVAVVYSVSHGVIWWVAILIGFAVGSLAGLINAIAVNVLNGNFMIVTLSTQTIFQGFALIIASGSYILIPDGNPILFIGRGNIFGFPMPILIFFLVAIILHFILSRTHFGRNIYFIGVNRRAASLCGISIKRYHSILYLVTAFFSSIGGIIISSRVGSTSTSIGKGFEFDAITAAVLGGVYLFGGKGSLPQAVLGVIIIAILANAQTLLGVPINTQSILKGAILALVIAAQELRKRSK